MDLKKMMCLLMLVSKGCISRFKLWISKRR